MRMPAISSSTSSSDMPWFLRSSRQSSMPPGCGLPSSARKYSRLRRMRCTRSARFTAWNQVEKARTRSRASAGGRPETCCCNAEELGLGTAAAVDRDDAIFFHELVETVPALLPQHLAHEHTQLVHVFAQRQVFGWKLDLIAVHGAAILPARPAPMAFFDAHAALSSPVPRSACCSPQREACCSRARDCSPRPCTRKAWITRR